MSISDAVDVSAVARVLGIEPVFKDLRGVGGIQFLPQRVAVVGQGNSAAVYSTDKKQVTSALQVAGLYGFGSPLHLAARQLLPANGDGVGTIPVTVYPLEDDGSGVAAAGDITPTVAQTEAASYRVRVNNIDSEAFVIDTSSDVASVVADMVSAINAVVEMPVTAVDNLSASCDLTAKWKGTSGNDIYVEIVGDVTLGTTFAVTQPTGGLVNPDVQPALDQVGNVWETMALNCLDTGDSTALDAYQTFGDGRWGALTRRPLVVFSGNNDTTVSAAITVPEGRKTDKVNAQLVAPGSKDLPLVIAARQLARIVKLANNNPPFDYGGRQATGLVPGDDGDQWDYAQRDQAVKGGSSTIEVRDGVVTIGDVVTFYHPSGDPLPAYRFVVDIVRLQNIIYNLDLIFAAAEWDGAPLIPDDQPTANRAAKKPKTARAAAAAMIDSLGLEAIISDPETAKANTQAEIDSQNPKRLNLIVPVQLSGNTNIKSIDLEFGFFFGTPTVVA